MCFINVIFNIKTTYSTREFWKKTFSFRDQYSTTRFLIHTPQVMAQPVYKQKYFHD